MNSQSVIVGVIEKFDALASVNFPSAVRPALYFDEAPVVNAAGAQVQPTTQGYCVLKDRGQTPSFLAFKTATSMPTKEVAEFDIEVYYPSLGDCDQAALAVKRNGGTTLQRLGFDTGSLRTLISPRSRLVIRRTREQRGHGGLGKTGVPVHFVRLSYRVEIIEDA